MTTPSSIRVYLDSSDYSQLSNPRLSSDMQMIRDQLIELAAQPAVSFVYSGAHISEMAPLEAGYARAATNRIDLLVKLCGRSTLISPDRLMEAELDRLKHRSAGVVAVTEDGTWFPDIGQIISPVRQIDLLKTTLQETALEMGLNRKQRRQLQSKAMKGGQLRKETLRATDGMNMDEILNLYPMRRDHAEILKRYALGEVGAEKAEQAFLESLRDPAWMMRWFHENHERMSHIGEWLRGPARKIADQMVDVVDKAAQALRVEQLTGEKIISPTLSAQGWKSLQDDFVVKTINSIADKLDAGVQCPDAGTADQYCPGFSTCIRVMLSSLRNSIGNVTRPPEHSDFVDAVHAMYAPYVTLFRADRYMSPIVASHVEKYGTAVVRKLKDLPDKIQSVASTEAALS